MFCGAELRTSHVDRLEAAAIRRVAVSGGPEVAGWLTQILQTLNATRSRFHVRPFCEVGVFLCMDQLALATDLFIVVPGAFFPIRHGVSAPRPPLGARTNELGCVRQLLELRACWAPASYNAPQQLCVHDHSRSRGKRCHLCFTKATSCSCD